MKNSITFKLFLILFAANLMVVAGMYLFMKHSFEQGFIEFVEERQKQHIDSVRLRLVEEYEEFGGWEQLKNNRRRWHRLLRRLAFEQRSTGEPPGVVDSSQGEHERMTPEGFAGRPPPRPPVKGLVLYDEKKNLVVGKVSREAPPVLHPVVVDNKTVGYLGTSPGPPIREIRDAQFAQSHARALMGVTLVMLLLSVTLSIPLAHKLIRPLQRIAEVSRKLGKGDYTARVPVTSLDELGLLAQDINDLATALGAAEHSRQQWVADISHELRTPVSILQGELEALQDGVRPLSKEAIQSLHSEVLRLGGLVEELYQLSLSDVGALSYRKASVNLVALLEETLEKLAKEFSKRQIQVQFDNRNSGQESMRADIDRLAQVFRNLLLNSLRYTDVGGRLSLTLSREKADFVIDFQDSAPGVPEDKLDQLFDRFFRLDPSRSRALGGAGLGLAITQRIVEAHDGTIEAKASPMGGLWVRLKLPVEGTG